MRTLQQKLQLRWVSNRTNIKRYDIIRKEGLRGDLLFLVSIIKKSYNLYIEHDNLVLERYGEEYEQTKTIRCLYYGICND